MNESAAPGESLPTLSPTLLRESPPRPAGLLLPPEGYEAWPESVVQFGTGAFLRGFVEYFLDEAARTGGTRGRVVMVGSTGSGRDRVIAEQGGLYTLCMRGREKGEVRDEKRVIGVVSRALSAATEWEAVLACARSPDLRLVFSNTTEVGIVLDPDDDPEAAPPRSFPGKLTRFLWERARATGFDPAAGVVVVPCELVESNGELLREMVLELAVRWELGTEFRRWVLEAVSFCNTLVDRIVPGTPAPAQHAELEAELGYRDALLTVSEHYGLFVVEGDDALRARLGFAEVPGVVVTRDVAPYRERKVRLLNGGHTVMVPAALLAGCTTVREAMEHPVIGRFLRRALLDEVVPTLDAPGSAEFAEGVLDRFANPFVEHELIDITLHGTAKMKVRVVPSILRYADRFGRVPQALACGFAAHLLFLRGDLHRDRKEAGLRVPEDGAAGRIGHLWDGLESGGPQLAERVRDVCAEVELWDADLCHVPGFVLTVSRFLETALESGVEVALETHLPAPHPHRDAS